MNKWRKGREASQHVSSGRGGEKGEGARSGTKREWDNRGEEQKAREENGERGESVNEERGWMKRMRWERREMAG